MGAAWERHGMRELAFTVHFYISLDMSLISKALRKSVPTRSPEAGPLWKQTPIPEPYLTYPSGSSRMPEIPRFFVCKTQKYDYL
jgi:hypothetical protein